jgi:hypothetical protein
MKVHQIEAEPNVANVAANSVSTRAPSQCQSPHQGGTLGSRTLASTLLHVAAIVFATAAVGKVVMLLGDRPALDSSDGVFGVPQRLVLFLGLLCELGMVGFIAFGGRKKAKLWCVLGVSHLFLTYRLVSLIGDGPRPCFCFGPLPQLFGLSESVAAWISLGALGFLWLTSLAFVLPLSKREQNVPPRSRSYLWIVALSAAGLSATLSAHPEPDSQVSAFKSFIASPPNIAQLVFKRRSAAVGGNFEIRANRSGDIVMIRKGRLPPAIDADGFHWFLARWQEDSYILRTIVSPGVSIDTESLSRLMSSYGRYGGRDWHLSGEALFEGTPPDGHSQAPPLLWAPFGLQILARVINLGISDVPIASITWDGDRFVTRSAVDPQIEISGRIEVAEGRVTRLILQYGPYPHEVQYYYRDSRYMAGIQLPQGWRRYSIASGQRSFREEVEILLMETSRKVQPIENFAPEVLSREETVAVGATALPLHSRVSRRLEIEGDKVYLKEDGSRTELRQDTSMFRSLEAEARRLATTRVRRMWLMLFFIGALLGPAVVYRLVAGSKGN